MGVVEHQVGHQVGALEHLVHQLDLVLQGHLELVEALLLLLHLPLSTPLEYLHLLGRVGKLTNPFH